MKSLKSLVAVGSLVFLVGCGGGTSLNYNSDNASKLSPHRENFTKTPANKSQMNLGKQLNSDLQKSKI
jgi:hypothetical protein